MDGPRAVDLSEISQTDKLSFICGIKKKIIKQKLTDREQTIGLPVGRRRRGGAR